MLQICKSMILTLLLLSPVNAMLSSSVLSFELNRIISELHYQSDLARVSFGHTPKKIVFPRSDDVRGIVRLSSLITLLQSPYCLNSSDTQEHLFTFFNSPITKNDLEAGPNAEYPEVLNLNINLNYPFLLDSNKITVSNTDSDILQSKLQELSLPLESTSYDLVDYVQPQYSDLYYYFDTTEKSIIPVTFFGILSFDSMSSFYIVADTPNIQDGTTNTALTQVQYQLVSSGQYYGKRHAEPPKVSEVKEYCLEPNSTSRNIVLSEAEYHTRYRLTGKVLGEGSFGKVSEVEEISSGQKFAVKEVITCMTDLRTFNSIQSEIEIMSSASLQHDNIMNIKALLYTSSKVYIVMESASTYGDSEHAIGRMNESVFHAMALNLTKGLAFMEKHNIIHRDIKMTNILFTNDGVVKYIDFGCAVTTGVATHIFGTLIFMAPEVLNKFRYGLTYGPKVDVYSLGATFLGLLFGSWTWNSRETDFKDLSFLTHDENWHLGNLLSQMLESDPKIRPFASELLNHPYFTNSESRNQVFPIMSPNQKIDL